MIVLLDNYDSFTYNLFQYMIDLGAEVNVFRNDEISIKEIQSLNPEKIVSYLKNDSRVLSFGTKKSP